jgi:hypothetical protein
MPGGGELPFRQPGEESRDWIYAPMLTSNNTLGKYAADTVRVVRTPGDCNKFVKTMSGMTEGLVAMFCPHRICIGFQILSRHEGPRIAFELIFKKFKIGPRLIVYDNACVLHMYCLKREPAFFARTQFRVDRLHFKNHVGCCEAYNLDSWAPNTPIVGEADMAKARAKSDVPIPDAVKPILLRDFNSQIAEQYNSRLRFIATQVAHMNHEMYMAYMVNFMYRFNACILASLFGRNELEMLRLLHAPRRTLAAPALAPRPAPVRRAVPPRQTAPTPKRKAAFETF